MAGIVHQHWLVDFEEREYIVFADLRRDGNANTRQLILRADGSGKAQPPRKAAEER